MGGLKSAQTRFVGIITSTPLYIPTLAFLDYHVPVDSYLLVLSP